MGLSAKAGKDPFLKCALSLSNKKDPETQSFKARQSLGSRVGRGSAAVSVICTGCPSLGLEYFTILYMSLFYMHPVTSAWDISNSCSFLKEGLRSVLWNKIIFRGKILFSE